MSAPALKAFEKSDTHPQMDAYLQLIAFHLDDEMYGLDIAAVHTVITPQPITYVPQAAKHIKGVINLRGRVLPVIDLRTRFGLPPLTAEAGRRTRIVIVETNAVSAGLIVDSVSEVLRLPAGAIDPPSQLVASAATDCITGIGRIVVGRRDGELREEHAPGEAQAAQERLIILLDVVRTLALSRETGTPLAQAA